MVFLLGILHKPLVKNKHNYLSYYYLSRFYICCYHAINNKSKSSFPGGTGVKNLPADAEDTRDTGSIPGSGRSLEKEMATHSSIHAWRIPLDRGAWRATWGHKESDMTEWLILWRFSTLEIPGVLRAVC